MATDTTQPSSHEGGSKPNTSTIGSGLLITGNVTANGKIHLEGQVQGEIRCASLVLGETSHLQGSAIAEEVVVGGCLIGSVRAVRLRLQAGAHVEGDLLSQSLAIEQGAYFDGQSQRSDDPLSPQQSLLGQVVQLPLQPNDKRPIARAPSFPESS
jgi:cytoskeletal protein CcmA (bactofilin family)